MPFSGNLCQASQATKVAGDTKMSWGIPGHLPGNRTIYLCYHIQSTPPGPLYIYVISQATFVIIFQVISCSICKGSWRLCVQMYMYVHIHLHICICIYVYVYALYAHSYIHICKCIYAHSYTHPNTLAHTHTHTHTYTHS